MGKTLIIHDRFQFRGGAERLVLDLAKLLEADIVTEFWTETTYPRSAVPHSLTVLDSGEPRMMVFRYFRAQWNFWWKTRKLIKNYDTIIFSGNNCLSAAIRPLPGKKLVYYCHAPVRYVYDLLKVRRAGEPSALKRFVYYDIGKWGIRSLYRLGLSRMQTVITNSQNVRNRLLRFCSRDSQVIYPPIHTEKFSWQGQGDYYVSFARLDSLKRVDDIVRAFQKMPDKKLIIASGGEDEQKIRDLAKGYENISVIGWVNDEKLKELVGNCIANIYIPIDEDFGMTAVEGMSAGKPCVGVDDGGLKETIVPQKTGLFIPRKYTIGDLVAAVESLTPERALAMRNECESAAQRFSVARFEREMKDVLSSHIAVDASRSIEGTQKTGVEVVSDELLKRISASCHSEEVSKLTEGSLSDAKIPHCVRNDKSTKVTFYTPKEISWLPKNVQCIITRRKFWTMIGLSLAMLRDKPDALFVPVHTLPFFCPKKTVRIVHDVAFLRHPKAYSLRERSYMRFDLWRTKRVCSSVIVPTEAVKHDLVELLGWNSDRIVVTGWGIPTHTCHPEGVSTSTERSLRKPFILFIGRIEEKKNVVNTIRAFEMFHQTHPEWEFVLAGKPGYGFEKIESLLNAPGVRHLGYVSSEKKAELFATASMLVLMSHEEGFGFPVLEAFQEGVPVLASSIPTLAEIAEDAALYADPCDIAAIAQKMAELADHPELCQELIKKGEKKLKKYSWDTVIQKVLKTLVY